LWTDLAYLGNLVFGIFVVVWMAEADRISGKDALWFVLFLALVAINIFALARSERDFLSAYFQRKKLEEEKRILALKNSMEKKS
jgi:hypothetical protein